MTYLIVGGVAGGAATAARLRRNDEKAVIIIFERGEYISYANCGLPYYLGETIKERDKLFVETAESFKRTLDVDVRISCEVTDIDKDAKTVGVKDRKSGREYREAYDVLILSPGAEPLRPPIPGIQSKRIFALRNVPDVDALKGFVDEKRPRRAVVVGAGFIGMEVAENLYDRGVNVTIVEMADQVMAPLDFEMAAQIHDHLKAKKVELYLSDGVKEFREEDGRLTILLNSGSEIHADLAVLSIGVRPETALAKAAGINVNRGILVNGYMETSAPGIYALGDAAEFSWPVTGKSGITPLAGPAGKQARILADNLVYGRKKSYQGAIGTAIAKIFDLTVAVTGVAGKVLEKEGVKTAAVITHGFSHAGYYPGALPMVLKLNYNPEDGKIQGAQIVGYDGVDKRIEMIAAVLRSGGAIEQLTELEQAYAPPYSSSKDPVNILGFTAENVFLGRSHHTSALQLKGLLEQDTGKPFLLDVRTPDEYAMGSLPGSVNIPKDEVRTHLAGIPRDRKIIVICGVGLRSYLVERILKQNGYQDVSILSGGLKVYHPAVADQSNRSIFTEYETGYEPGRENEADAARSPITVLEVDACGLQCPGPILKLKTEIDRIKPGERLLQRASDPGFARDVQSWCNMTGHRLVSLKEQKGIIEAVIQRSGGPVQPVGTATGVQVLSRTANEMSLICFSDDMDKALASLVIANGALASGKKVTIFYTFWGLDIIKKQVKPRVRKTLMGRMFGMMLPGHNGKLKLSKLNMGGMGAFMMKGIMKHQKIDNLETMLRTALDNGAELIACQMSMDVMGVKREELLDEVQIGGVANYLEAATHAGINLFI
ncbi:MAG: FAD-dependent oxidoreductase [Spirochaetia bacterium]|jgi:NADPH-dependent 2,4-dienoyl-CoA reductase/sulfur reductase-like enzyme/peroxiredoxin family protein/rhodanese-related sulfurtransferase/TusA-related sulfurtransferase|nr:FAD-dependent oxidoreductase [Spirochaetia bacterium]